MTLISRHQAMSRAIRPFKAVGNAQPSPTGFADSPAATLTSASPSSDQAVSMREQISELESALENERALKNEARAAAFAEGREKGMAEADGKTAEKLELLRRAIARATTDCAAAIDQRGDLAVAISQAALEKILGDAGEYGPMIEAVIRHNAAQIAVNTVVTVRVSASDFADEGQLATLSIEHGVRIESDEKLPAGSCLFDLTLGTVDASIPVQASAVNELLAPLVSVEESRG